MSFRFQLTGPDGLEVTAANGYTAFTDSDTISAAVWRGDDQATLFAPEAEWITASLATVRISLSETDTDQTPGDYLCQLTAGTTKQLIGRIRITPSPGSGTAPVTICALSDMQTLAGDGLEELLESNDQTNFGEARGQACKWTWRCVLSRARTLLEGQAERYAPIEEVDPIEPTDGVDHGPDYGPSTIPNTTLRDDLDDVRGWLTSGYLMADDELVQANAHYALYRVYARQRSGGDKDNEYRTLAKWHFGEAKNLMAGITLRIDTNGDDVAEREYPPV